MEWSRPKLPGALQRSPLGSAEFSQQQRATHTRSPANQSSLQTWHPEFVLGITPVTDLSYPVSSPPEVKSIQCDPKPQAFLHTQAFATNLIDSRNHLAWLKMSGTQRVSAEAGSPKGPELPPGLGSDRWFHLERAAFVVITPGPPSELLTAQAAV